MIFVVIQIVTKPYLIHFTALSGGHTNAVTNLKKYQNDTFFISILYRFRPDYMKFISNQSLRFPLGGTEQTVDRGGAERVSQREVATGGWEG